MIIALTALILFNFALELHRVEPNNDMPSQVVWEYGGHDWRNVDGKMTHDKNCKHIDHNGKQDNN